MVLPASVARSTSSNLKLWTGKPSAVTPVACLVSAAIERAAFATALARRASAATLHGSSAGDYPVLRGRQPDRSEDPDHARGQRGHADGPVAERGRLRQRLQL